jgi:transcriptional regulator with PAS, ATPase and Fis domain
MDSVTINLEDNNRIVLLIGGVTLELVVRRPKDVTSETEANEPDTVSLSLRETQKIQIQRVLDMCKGNKRRAARILGISRASVYNYLKSNPRTAVSESVDTARLGHRVS